MPTGSQGNVPNYGALDPIEAGNTGFGGSFTQTQPNTWVNAENQSGPGQGNYGNNLTVPTGFTDPNGHTIQYGGFAQGMNQSNLDAAQQQQTANQLSQLAQGKGPSAAQALLQQQTNQGMANNNAMAASASGQTGQGAARRQAMMQNSQMMQNLGGQAATARAQEQLGALGQLGGLQTTMRNQDVGTAQAFDQAAAQQASLNLGQSQLAQQQSQFNTGTMMNLGSGAAGAVGSALPYVAMGLMDADLKEPNRPESDAAHWTIREEKDFLLAKNQRTGQLYKLATQPLTPEEKRQAMASHGAGPLGAEDPRRKRTVVHDFNLGGGGYGDETTLQSNLDKLNWGDNPSGSTPAPKSSPAAPAPAATPSERKPGALDAIGAGLRGFAKGVNPTTKLEDSPYAPHVPSAMQPSSPWQKPKSNVASDATTNSTNNGSGSYSDMDMTGSQPGQSNATQPGPSGQSFGDAMKDLQRPVSTLQGADIDLGSELEKIQHRRYGASPEQPFDPWMPVKQPKSYDMGPPRHDYASQLRGAHLSSPKTDFEGPDENIPFEGGGGVLRAHGGHAPVALTSHDIWRMQNGLAPEAGSAQLGAPGRGVRGPSLEAEMAAVQSESPYQAQHALEDRRISELLARPEARRPASYGSPLMAAQPSDGRTWNQHAYDGLAEDDPARTFLRGEMSREGSETPMRGEPTPWNYRQWEAQHPSPEASPEPDATDRAIQSAFGRPSPLLGAIR